MPVGEMPLDPGRIDVFIAKHEAFIERHSYRRKRRSSVKEDVKVVLVKRKNVFTAVDEVVLYHCFQVSSREY
ncbi:hypothetical protein ACFL13_02165 [Patescibacteria group bacterium]